MAPRDLYVAVVTILVIELGMQRMERRDAAQGAVLRAWMDNRIRPAFRGRVLPFNEAATFRCAGLHALAGRPLGRGRDGLGMDCDAAWSSSVAQITK